MKARIIRVDIEETPGGLFTRSPDLKGLVIGEPTREVLLARVAEALKLLMEARGESVSVHEAEGATSARVTFVIVPAAGQLDRCA